MVIGTVKLLFDEKSFDFITIGDGIDGLFAYFYAIILRDFKSLNKDHRVRVLSAMNIKNLYGQLI